MGLALCWFSVRLCLVERTVLGNGCLVELGEGDQSLLQGNSGVEHSCLALWMMVWITDSFAEMGWLGLQSKYLSMWVDFCRLWIQWS